MDHFLIILILFKNMILKSYMKPFIAFLAQVLPGFLILLILYLIGEWIAGWIPFPVPGAVVGMILIFVLLQSRLIPLTWVEKSTDYILIFMGMFYIPYGVGIVESGYLLSEWGGSFFVLVVVSVCGVFFFSGHLFQYLTRSKIGSNE